MRSLEAARADWAEWARRTVHPMMTLTEEGLVLGAGTVLAKAGADRWSRPTLAVDGAEERILTLLAVAYGKPIDPAILGHIRRASEQLSRGEPCLALIHLAYTGLSKLADEQECSFRLFLAERALADGVAPSDLLKACGIDSAALDLLRAGYDPNQPRVLGGNPSGGQWTEAGPPAGRRTAPRRIPWAGPAPEHPKLPAHPRSNASATGHLRAPAHAPPGGSPASDRKEPRRPLSIPVDYTPVHELPSDAKVVIPRDGLPILDPDSPTKFLMAPPRADFREVYAAGRVIARLPVFEQYSRAREAIAQEGIYDFQRDVPRQKFYDHYVPAANYAVGVYMAGASYSLETTLAFAKLYALRHSRNYDSRDQLGWIERGWTDAVRGRWR
jgi:hypothetical protein